MGFFKHRKVEKTFDLFSRFNHYNPGLGGIIAFLLLAVAGSLLGSGLMSLLGFLYPAEMLEPYRTFISYPLIFIPPMLFASVMSMKNEYDVASNPLDRNNFGSCGIWILAPAVSIATLSLSVIIDPVSALLPPMPPEMKAMMGQLMDGPFLITLISVSVFAPFFEEWLCRGMVLRGLLTRMHPVFAILISALFFAILHMNPWQALPAFLIGIFFGWVYYRTGSLKLTMLMHCTNNTFALLMRQPEGFKDIESFQDILSPVSWWLLFAACLLIVIGTIVYIRKGTASETAA